MSNLFKENDYAIDVEIIKNHLPEGCFAVMVNKDSYDEDIFEYHLGDDANIDDFIEVLLVSDSPKDAYIVQGEVVFINMSAGKPEVHYTQDTAVKRAEDVTLLNYSEAIGLDSIRKLSR